MVQFTDARFNELKENVQVIYDNTKAQVENLLKETFGDKYVLVWFGTSTLRIGFLAGTYKSGEPRYRDIDIQHGYDYKYQWEPEIKAIEYFRFESNVGGCGNFDLFGEDKENIEVYNYYMMVANILSNVEFKTSLKQILLNMADSIKPIQKEMRDIENTYVEMEQKRIAKENADKKENEFQINAEKLKNAGPNDFVIIKKGVGGKFTYRRGEVDIVEVGSDYNELDKMMWKLHRETGIRMAVVEVNKVQLAA